MKLLQLTGSLGLALAFILGSSQGATADLSTCKRALTKAQESYLVAVAKAKAKEAKGRMPGQKFVPASITAARIAKALEKSRLIIQTGCAGVTSPNDADPNLCPTLDFDACLADSAARADVIADDSIAAVFPPAPLCIDEPPPTCEKDPLPICEHDNGCTCHTTAEGAVDCINGFACATAQPCTSSVECPPGAACYMNTCCGPGGVCGRSTCEPSAGTPVNGPSSAR